MIIHRTTHPDYETPDPGCWGRFTHRLQDGCYQVMARTCWDWTVSGFRPGRVRSIELMDIQATDRVLLVGEGSGLDLEYLPDHMNKAHLRAFDFSDQMVTSCRQKAAVLNIPEENIFQGDAQHMTLDDRSFDKIFFPLSLGSIPDPAQALREAERVLAPGGRIVVMEKMVDDGHQPSCGRKVVNFFTKCVFADINRNLRAMVGDTPLEITQYEDLAGQLNVCFAGFVGRYYRIAVLERPKAKIE
jgi:phosphatidylethanolamine/phosphatidyl-N-methylethanolamine N-methyltransferase